MEDRGSSGRLRVLATGIFWLLLLAAVPLALAAAPRQADSASSAQVQAGSWDLWRTDAQTDGANDRFDWYFGVSAGGRGDYESGDGGTRMENTGWKRRGASGALGWQLHELHRVELQLRTDGIYNAGFRGSGANIYSRDNRSNHSLDLTYEGALPG